MEATMSAVKEQIKHLINSLPDDSSYEDIMREVAFARMVEKIKGVRAL